MTVRQTIWEAKEQNTGFLPYSLLVNVPSWRPLNQVKKDTEAVYIIKVPEYWQTTKNNCACVFSDENLRIFLTLLCQGAALTWVQQMRYQPISFRRGGKNCSLAMKVRHFKGLIYFLYSVILVLGAFLQHIRSLQTPVSLWLIYNNITICSSFHLLHQATKLNYQVRKKWESQNNDVEQVSVELPQFLLCEAEHFRNWEHSEQPMPSPRRAAQDSGIYTEFIEVTGPKCKLSFPHPLILP